MSRSDHSKTGLTIAAGVAKKLGEATRAITHANWLVTWDVVMDDGRTVPLDGIYLLPKNVMPKRFDALRQFLHEQSETTIKTTIDRHLLTDAGDEAMHSLCKRLSGHQVAYIALKIVQRV